MRDRGEPGFGCYQCIEGWQIEGQAGYRPFDDVADRGWFGQPEVSESGPVEELTQRHMIGPDTKVFVGSEVAFRSPVEYGIRDDAVQCGA
jgi:hypothetical protein